MEVKGSEWNHIETTKLQIEIGIHLITDYDQLVFNILQTDSIIDRLYSMNVQKPQLELGSD